MISLYFESIRRELAELKSLADQAYSNEEVILVKNQLYEVLQAVKFRREMTAQGLKGIKEKEQAL